MQIPARFHYAALAMIELASAQAAGGRPSRQPLSLRQIACQHDIPQPFLVQILRQLKARGWVLSSRGAGGGYRLAPGATSLTLWQIAEAVGCGELAAPRGQAHGPAAAELQRVWQQAAAAHRDALQRVTLGDLVEAAAGRQEGMFYI